MIANGSRFYDGVGANVNIVANLHRVIIECTAIRLVRGPKRDEIASDKRVGGRFD